MVPRSQDWEEAPEARWRERALIVGGDPDSRESAAGVLEAAGYEVRAVGMGREAAQMRARWRPGVILLGPAGSGVGSRVFSAAHARGDFGDVPLVVLGPPGSEEGVIVVDLRDAPDLLTAMWVAANP